MQNKLLQLCKNDPLSKSSCFLDVCSPCKMIPHATQKLGIPHYSKLPAPKLKLPK
uniref:Uncharacterized protein n=1 Tax=Arundo donax TaxID=35708 RepID=A0A0A8YSP9_ARUDO